MAYDEKLNSAFSRAGENAEELQNIVLDIVKRYTADLDEYLDTVDDTFANGGVPTSVLEDYCLNLSTLLYFANGKSEMLGLREDVSKALYKEVYNSARDNATGTVADKSAIAEMESQYEQFVNICYSRAYKMVKAKVESAQEVLSSCKKIITSRIAETELTRMGGN